MQFGEKGRRLIAFALAAIVVEDGAASPDLGVNSDSTLLQNAFCPSVQVCTAARRDPKAVIQTWPRPDDDFHDQGQSSV